MAPRSYVRGNAGKKEVGRETRLSKGHPGGTKLTFSGCKERFELEPKRLGPGRERLRLLGDQEA